MAQNFLDVLTTIYLSTVLKELTGDKITENK